MKIQFIPANKHPEESGQYLWRSCFGGIMLVSVRKLDSSLGMGSYFSITEFGGRNVEAFDPSQFSEKIEFVDVSASPKTNKDWLNTLPEPIKSKALANSYNEFETGSLSKAISGSFIWDEAQEGRQYWSDIHNRAEKGEFTK